MPDPQPRSFDTVLRPPVIDGIQQGALATTYRGIPCLKSPFDLVLYSELIDRQGTASVIEVGTKYGGSALWFADAMSIRGSARSRVLSVDIQSLTEFQDPRIEFVVGDAGNLGQSVSAAMLDSLPHPWLVVEDSSHLYADATAVLDFFDKHLQTGDYIVVEDGILTAFSGANYARYEDGPSRAVHDFLARRGADYEIDTQLCDQFGYNATWNPNGWLRRIS